MNKADARKTVNVAVIGAGFMGSEHSKAYSLSPVIFPDIAATPVKKILCDIDADVVKKKADQWGYEEWCTDWKEIINRDDIDIVDLCNPPFLHLEMAVEFMKAGKFVFVEKPITATLEDCEELVAQAKKLNGRTAVAFNKRRWPAVNLARKLLKEGAIGEPLIYNGRYSQGFLLQEMPYTFRSERDKGGGFADSGSHVLDMARFILDDKYDEVVGVAEVIDTEVTEYPKGGGAPIKRKKDAEDLSMVIARMKSGVIASTYQTSKYGGSGEDISFEVLGRKGTMRWSGANPSVFQIFQKDENNIVTNGFRSVLMGPAHPYGQAVPPLAGFGVGVVDNMSFQAYEVVNACVNNTKYSPDFEEAYEIAKVCEAVRESTKTKTWVKIK